MLKQSRKINGMRVQNLIEEIPMNPSTTKKDKIRLQIQDEVFDNQDAIADNSKMISLMLTMMSRLYDVTTEEAKTSLASTDREMIEYMFDKFAVSRTRADAQFETEGSALIDRLIDRQAKIGTIVS